MSVTKLRILITLWARLRGFSSTAAEAATASYAAVNECEDDNNDDIWYDSD